MNARYTYQSVSVDTAHGFEYEIRGPSGDRILTAYDEDTAIAVVRIMNDQMIRTINQARRPMSMMA